MDILEVIWTVICWAVFGLIVGALARLLHPGRDSMGLVATMVLGIVGSLVGGGIWFLIRALMDGEQAIYSPAGFLLSLISAIVLLALGLFVKESGDDRRGSAWR